VGAQVDGAGGRGIDLEIGDRPERTAVAIRVQNVDGVALEPWEPEGLEVLEGDPQTRGHIFFESGPDGGGFGPGGTVVGVYEQQPCKTRYRLVQTETVHLLDGDIQIELDNGESVGLRPGEITVLEKGNVSTWAFRSASRVLFVLSP